MSNEPKVLFIDIETCYPVMASWSLWPNFIGHDNILQEWYIVTIAYKWLGKKKVHLLKNYTKNDKKILLDIKKVIEQADEIVAHNGEKFDFKKLQARAIVNDIGPIPKPKFTDTLKQAKKHFGFICNKLDYITHLLGMQNKDKVGNDLWLRVLAGEKKAVDEMGAYNKTDVVILEKLYFKMLPYIDATSNKGLYLEREDVCPRCASPKIEKRGFARTQTGKYQRYQCKDCAGWFKGASRLNKATKVMR